MENFKNKAIRGFAWSAVERFSAQSVQFVFSFIIARQLMPSDYGLIAMLDIFIGLAQTFIDSGFPNALIQKQSRTDIDFSTVFYFNIVVSIFFYLLLVVLSSFIADFYNQHQLETIIKWVAISFIINAFGTVQRVKLTISLNFKRQAWISLVSVLASGICAVWMAYNNYGIWTLVYRNLLNNLLNTALLWVSTHWTPLFIFSFRSFKELFGFGSKLLLSGLISNLYANMYTLVIGKVFSPTDLGLFNRAETVSKFPAYNFTCVLVRVVYPIECELQNENRKLQEKFYLFIRMAAFIIFPLMICVAVLAEPIVRLTLTEKWIGAVPFIQILCLAYMWDPIMRMTVELLSVKCRSDYTLRSEILKRIVAFGVLFLSILGGLKVMCLGLVIYALLDIFVVTRYTKRILPLVTFREEMIILLPILLRAIAMGSIVYFLKYFIFSDALLLVVGVTVGVITYFVISILTKSKEIYYILHRKKGYNFS